MYVVVIMIIIIIIIIIVMIMLILTLHFTSLHFTTLHAVQTTIDSHLARLERFVRVRETMESSKKASSKKVSVVCVCV